MSESTRPPPRSRLARVLLGLLIFTAVVAAVFLALRFFVDRAASDASRRIIEQRLSAALGLTVEIRGDFQVELLPRPHFRLHDLVILNPPGEPTPNLLEVGTVSLALDLGDLLSGEYHISDLDFRSAKIHFDGELESLAVRPHPENLADEQTDGTLPFEIRLLELEDVELYYGDDSDTGIWSVYFERVALRSARFDAPVKLEVRGRMQGGLFDLEGELGSISQLVATTRPYPVRVEGRLFEGQVEVRGQIAAPLKLEGVDLEMRASIDNLDALLREPGRNLPSVGPVAASGRLVDHDGALGLEDLEIGISDPALRAHLTGSIADVAAGTGVDLQLESSLDDMKLIDALAERQLPRLAPVEVSATLSDRDGSLGVTARATAGDPSGDLRVKLEGSHGDLRRMDDLDIGFEISARDLELLGAELPLDTALPRIGPVTLAGRLEGKRDALGVENLTFEIGSRDSIRVKGEGAIGNLVDLSDPQLALRFEIEAHDLKQLGETLALDEALPEIGPVQVKGRLAGKRRALALDPLSFSVGSRESIWGEGEGTIGSLTDLENTQLSLRFGVEHLPDLGQLTGGAPPEVGPIRGSATLSDRDGTLGLESFHVEGGRKGVLELEARGSLEDLSHLDEIALDARLDARDLAVVGELAGVELPPLGPVSFHGNIKGSNEKVESRGEARIDQTRFTGTWSGSFAPGVPPRVEASLRSPLVRLRDVGIEPSDAQLLNAPPVAAGASAERWWEGSAELPFDWLRRVDGKVALEFAQITGRSGFRLTDTRAKIALDGGDLAIPDFATTYEGGEVSASLRIDARTPEPEVALVGTVTGASLAVLMAQLIENTRSSGIVDASIDLRGRGVSIDAIRSSLDGTLQMRFRDWAVASLYMDRVVKDMIGAFIRTVSEKTPDALDCVAVDLDIDDGIAQVRDFVLETGEATVHGKGKIDLRKQKIDVTLTPEVHNPGLLGIAAEVLVTGSLDDPEFRSSKASLATSATRGLLYNALRPGIALVDAFRRSSKPARTADTVCRPSAGGTR